MPNNAPVFNDGAPLDLSVGEDVNINWSIATVAGSDADGDTLSYSLGGDDASHFRIDAATGELFFDYWPDYERPADAGQNNTYDIIVNMSDGTDTVSKAVTVQVTNVNEDPQWNDYYVDPLPVAENTTAVGQVQATDPESGGNLTYSIGYGYDGGLFTIDSQTGQISFKAAPDFENPADSDHNNAYRVAVMASDGVNLAYTVLTVQVQDVAENMAPDIVSSHAPVVLENTTSVLQVLGVDPDSDPLTYAIDGGADARFFAIDAATGALSFVSAPDFESPADKGGDNTYEVVVSASDGSHTTLQTLNVQVGNDNEAPVILGASELREISYSEIQSYDPFMDGGDTSVTRITASDPEGHGLTYTLTGADSNRFWISSYDGALYFNSTPDYERPSDANGNNVYDVTVGVSDGVNTVFQSVSVTVTDGNDAPTFITDFTNAPHIAENTTYITTVLGTDQDAGTSLTYSIGDGPDAALFQIDAQTGAFSFRAAPDYENPADENHDNIYMTFVNISDGVNTVNQFVWVYVDNVEQEVNHAPVFTNTGPVNVSVQENTWSMWPFVTVNASDADAADRITYSLDYTGDARWFMIDPRDGGISMMGSPDFENPEDANHDNIYQLTVNASDGVNTVSTTVNVQITDGYDYPFWVHYLYDPIHAAENQTGAVTLEAGSQNPGATFTYEIGDGADRALFNIDRNTGVITFKEAPDFENPGDANHNNVYELFVAASDGINGIFMGVNIVVDNVAVENVAPVFNGGAGTLAITVPENRDNSQILASVGATDATAGDTLAYSLSGADADQFLVNQSTGDLYFRDWMNYEAPADANHDNTYDVTVNVTDGVNTVSRQVSVHVGDMNDAPQFVGDSSPVFTVDENTAAVGVVTATDEDSGTTLTYSLMADMYDNDLFQIDSQTGALSFRAAPDFENPLSHGGGNDYTIAVQVSDGITTSSRSVSITVNDVNEAPRPGGVLPAVMPVTLPENWSAGVKLGGLLGDPERLPLTYSVVGGADAALFTMDPATGMLNFITPPDFENRIDADHNGVYEVVLGYSDGVNLTTQAFALTVVNLDEAPVLTMIDHYTVAENNSGFAIPVTASDPEGGALYYYLDGVDAAQFSVDKGTGAITFTATPDFEGPRDANHDNVYSLLLTVSDGTNKASQAITVTVTDVNEAPILASGNGALPLNINLPENWADAVALGKMAKDVEGSPLTYSIAGGADAALFRINAATGEVSFITPPDYERPADQGGNNVYDVVVGYGDGVNVSTQAYTFTITNLAEAPVITSNGGGATAAITMGENLTAVTTVQATDADAGSSIAYAITGGADAGMFTINAATGALAFKVPSDYDTAADADHDNVYDVVVSASDGALGDTQALRITLTDSDTGTGIGGTGDEVLHGTVGRDLINGYGGNDTIWGEAGNDTLYGGAGNDSLLGGLGDDLFFVTDAGDRVVENAGEGNDTVNSSVDFTLGANIETLIYTGSGNWAASGNDQDNWIYGGAGADTIHGQGGNDYIAGGAGDDTAYGDDGADSLVLGAGNDHAYGGAGNDTLNGGTGNDTLEGGAGDDAYYVDSLGDSVVEAAGGGTDTVFTTVDATLWADVEKLMFTGTGNWTGTGNAIDNYLAGGAGNDTLSGLGGNDALSGGAGNDSLDGGDGFDKLTGGLGDDTLNGGDGNDSLDGSEGDDRILGGAGNDSLAGGLGTNVLTGGAGDDLYIVSSSADSVVELSGEGNDTISALVDFTMGDHVESMIFNGTGNWTGAGNDQANWIYGNAGNDRISGLAGNDYLSGNAGNDSLDGGEGNDALSGGIGDDTLLGGAGNDTLYGDAGNDSMTGGAGDDTYFVNSALDAVVEAVGEGHDTVMATISTTLADNVESLIFNGVGNFTGTGNGLANYIAGGAGNDVISGLAGDDALYGSDGADAIFGGEGQDTLNGGYGRDTMTGGAGDDSYWVDNALDLVVEADGEGRDTVFTTVDLTLAANVEKLIFIGTGAWNGTGNGLANYIAGGAGNDVISGLAGDDALYGSDGADAIFGGEGQDTLNGGYGRDTMTGGAGDDSYWVDNALDLVVEADGEGRDTVFTTVDLTLAANVEKLIFIGTGAWNGTGNETANYIAGGDASDTLSGLGGDDVLLGGAGNDQLYGGDGADSLNGGTGTDTMAGGIGNDVYTVDSVGDVVTENSGEGTDTILTSVDLSLADNVEQMLFNGAGVWNGTGNGLDNYLAGGNSADVIYGLDGDDMLVGNGGNDQLYGGEGNDSLYGGAGVDTMAGGNGNDAYTLDNPGDVVVENADEGSDTLMVTFNYALGDNIEKLMFTGTGNWTGTGNGLNNFIAGGAGDDTINGGGGADAMDGGLGADLFIFSSVADAAAGDVINDFNRGQGDLIDLSAIDANTLTAEDDEFSWVGNAGFSNTAGELRYELVLGNVTVSGDVDGDGVADFSITLKGVTGETPAFGGILLGANTVDWHDFVL